MSDLPIELGMKGRFVVDGFYSPAISGEVVSIRTLDDYFLQKQNPFELVYSKLGLDSIALEADHAAKVRIIGIKSGQAVYLIPEYQITGLPSRNLVPYSYLTVAINLGLMPDAFETALLTERLTGLIADTVGVQQSSVELRFVRVPYGSSITQDEHSVMESARVARRITDDSDRARLLKVTDENAELRARIARYEQMLTAT